MTSYYASPSFPFAQLFPMGVAMIIMGVVQMALGIVDLVYTHLKFGSLCKEENYLTDWECPAIPCENASHIWAIVSPGLWGGLMTILAGGFTTSLMYASSVSIKTKRDTAAVVCGFVAFPVGPAAITMCALRLYFQNGVFYCLDLDDNLTVSDFLQFLMPIIVATSVFVGWCLAFGVLVAMCRRGRLSTRDEFDLPYGNQRYPEYEDKNTINYAYSDPGRGRPQMGPDYDYDRPRYYPWQDRARNAWGSGPFTVDRPHMYGGGGRPADPYSSYPGNYRDRSRDYYTTKNYNR